jgi:hypothetical protein
MPSRKKQRESDAKLADQAVTIAALIVGVLVWGYSHSFIAGLVTFGVGLVVIEVLLVLLLLPSKGASTSAWQRARQRMTEPRVRGPRSQAEVEILASHADQAVRAPAPAASGQPSRTASVGRENAGRSPQPGPRQDAAGTSGHLAPTIHAVDSMSWSRFEHFVAELLRSRGYRTSLTETYDFGADVIAEREGERLLVQAKHSTGPDIGNKGVQQVVAAMAYYRGTRAMVVTNRRFTLSAIKLARANNVELWDRGRLAHEIQRAFPRPGHPL